MDTNEILLRIKNDIGFIRGELEGINKNIKRINGNIVSHDAKIDVLETDCSKLQEAFKPIKKAFGQFLSFSVGTAILLGGVVLALVAFLKGKFGL